MVGCLVVASAKVRSALCRWNNADLSGLVSHNSTCAEPAAEIETSNSPSRMPGRIRGEAVCTHPYWRLYAFLSIRLRRQCLFASGGCAAAAAHGGAAAPPPPIEGTTNPPPCLRRAGRARRRGLLLSR